MMTMNTVKLDLGSEILYESDRNDLCLRFFECSLEASPEDFNFKRMSTTDGKTISSALNYET